MLTFLKRLASLVPAPAAGKVTLFVDDAGDPVFKDEAGVVHSMVGGEGPEGPEGPQGEQGPAGADGAQGPAGPGVAAGGTTGQVLRKTSGADYATGWATITASDIGAALDTAVVHKTGDETISGFKTFSEKPQVSTSSAATLGLRRTGQNAANNSNSAVQYEIAYTNGTSSSIYFGMAALSTVPYFAVGSNPNLSSSTYSWMRMGEANTIIFNLGRCAQWQPLTTNTYSLGAADALWTQVYAANAAINTSDARLKTDPRSMSSAEVAAFSQIARLPNVWEWLTGDRLHGGPTVQAAMAIMEANGLEPFDYACFCYDRWDAKEAVIESWDDEFDPDTGELVREAGSQIAEPAVEAGDRYSFRKEELLCFIVAAQARQHDELAERVAALEAKA